MTSPGSPPAPRPAVWLLPAGGGEARRIAAPPGGVDGLVAARSAAVFACQAGVLPGAADATDDAARRKARADAGMNAILHEAAACSGTGTTTWARTSRGCWPRRCPPAETVRARPRLTSRDLTPDAVPWTLEDQSFDLTPDGSAVVAGWTRPRARPASGHRTQVVVLPRHAGGRGALCWPRRTRTSGIPRWPRTAGWSWPCGTPTTPTTQPGDRTLVVVPLAGGEPRDLLAGFDRWPVEAAWAPDSRAVYFTADDQGRRPVFRADLATGEVTRITPDDGAYASLCPAPDGSCLYALRDAIDAAPAPVRVDLAPSADQPGRLTWLASPAPGPGPARPAHRGAGERRGRHPDPGLAGAARRGQRTGPRAAAAVGSRRTAVQLEQLVLAVEPVAHGGPRLRRPAARPGPVDRLRAAHDGARPRHLGRAARTPTSWPSPTRWSSGPTSTTPGPP